LPQRRRGDERIQRSDGRIKPDKQAGSNLHVAGAAYAENEKKTKKQLIDGSKSAPPN
jgi:hypothetical protein